MVSGWQLSVIPSSVHLLVAGCKAVALVGMLPLVLISGRVVLPLASENIPAVNFIYRVDLATYRPVKASKVYKPQRQLYLVLYGSILAISKLKGTGAAIRFTVIGRLIHCLMKILIVAILIA